ncbi:ABC transporter substrate-binding protein [Pseudonocardia sp. NPDC049154]|uniref:ABC transporter substrate-binding protein n=1 Tax=Pseudonocardia sp. NPDC049154 TaxID=3155501 RepID=UPI0033D1310C
MRRSRAALLLLVPLLVAACATGGGTATSKDSVAGALTPEAGCEGYGVSAAPGGPVARCAPGAPAPKPLVQPATIVMNMPTGFEFAAPWYWAKEHGEFEKENLTVEIQNLPSADAYTLTAQGRIDFACSGPNAPMYNAIAQGFDIKWVTGSIATPASSKSGLWARKGTSLADLQGKVIASAAGPGSASLYPVDRMLTAAGGGDLSGDTVKTVSGPDMQQALEAGAIDAGIFLDPRWVPLEQSGNFEFLGSTTPPGESLLGCIAGPSFYAKRDAAVAFLRAVSRTVNTTFAGDYHADPAVVADVARMMGTTPAELVKTPSPVFDLLVRTNTSEPLQQTYRKTNALQYSEILPDDRVVDRTLLEEAHGVRFGS